MSAVLALISLSVSAQTERNDSVKVPETAMPEMTIPTSPLPTTPSTTGFSPMMMQPSSAIPLQPEMPRPTMDLNIQPYRPTSSLGLWRGASLTANGSQTNMVGMMDISSGSLTLRQDFGRFHITASGIANKYWIPGINSMTSNLGEPMLTTQWGFGGAVSYDVSPALSLHAFTTYYATNPMLGAAMSPYVSTTDFGGYADVRISEHFGSYIGVERHINPISGKWITDPIVTPYIKVGKDKKSRIQLPIGNLLKTLIWGDRDNPMRFRPLPQPQQQPKK